MSYVFFKKDSSGRAINIDLVHDRIHNGESFSVFHNNSSLASGSTMNIYFKTDATASKAPHIIASAYGSGEFDFEILEAPTVTSATGTTQVVFNKNRQSSNVSSVLDNQASPVAGSVMLDVTTTADGTIISQDFLGANKDGGQATFENERVLKTDTAYVFRLTSRSASNRVHINLDWYHPVI